MRPRNGQRNSGLFKRWRTAPANERKQARMGKPDFFKRGPERTGVNLQPEAAPSHNNMETAREKRARPELRCLVGQTLVFLGAGNESFRDGRDGGMLQGHDGPLQRNLQHFVHGLYKMNRETGEDLLRDVR